MSTEKEVKTPVTVTMSNLKALLDEGKSKEEIGKEFGLNAANTTKLFKSAKEAGLKIKIKRTVKPRPAAFVLITDENEIPVETTITADSIIEKPTKVKKTVTDDSDLIQITNKVEDVPTTDVTEDNEW